MMTLQLVAELLALWTAMLLGLRAALVVAGALYLLAVWSLWKRQRPCNVMTRIALRLGGYTVLYLVYITEFRWPI